MGTQTIQIYDCGCVPSRPKEQSCRSYGTRWRVYMTAKSMKLRCLDCNRLRSFDLIPMGPQTIRYMGQEVFNAG